MMYNYTVQNSTVVGDILLLTLAPAERSRRVQFEPGQYATIGFQADGRPTPMRCFSITSTPASGVLQFAMRIRGRFTQAATRLQPGDRVRVQGPFGEFTINSEYDRRVVLLAGGIGITPFMSMIRNATEQQLALPITLLFTNRSAADIPFFEELLSLAQRNPYLNIRFYCTDTASMADAPSFVIPGPISNSAIQELAQTSDVGSTYFICGPKGFTEAMQDKLRAQEIHESRIITESFSQTSTVSIWQNISARALVYSLAAATFIIGLGGITVMDLSRAVPRLASTQTQTTQTVTGAGSGTTAVTGNTNSSATTSTGTSGSSGNGSSSSSSSTPTSSQPSYQNYQPPVSSVS